MSTIDLQEGCTLLSRVRDQFFATHEEGGRSSDMPAHMILECYGQGAATLAHDITLFLGKCLPGMYAKAEEPRPIPMLLVCPLCRVRHIDEGEFATKVHHTHSCQACGLTWRPAIVPTVGVLFLPGFKNKEPSITEALVASANISDFHDECRQLMQVIMSEADNIEQAVRLGDSVKPSRVTIEKAVQKLDVLLKRSV
jgi:hypothetical protein